MSVDTTSKAARRQIADEFKERKVPRGIFAIHCSITDDAWVGSSTNLNAVRNLQWFQLRSGAHRNLSLQAAWKHHTEEAFQLGILEQFDEDVSPLLLNDLLTTKKKKWAGTLQAKVL